MKRLFLIRQEGYSGGDDSVVIIPRMHMEAVLLAIKAEFSNQE